jgi:hypothetical protein
VSKVSDNARSMLLKVLRTGYKKSMYYFNPHVKPTKAGMELGKKNWKSRETRTTK